MRTPGLASVLCGAAALLQLACGDDAPGNADGAPGTPDGPPGAIDAPPGTPDGGPTPDGGMPGVCSRAPVSGTPTLTLEPVPSTGDLFAYPVLVTSPPGDPRLFVVEQHSGLIRVIEDDAVLATPFLQITGLAGSATPGNEQGLLGLAFHPDFA